MRSIYTIKYDEINSLQQELGLKLNPKVSSEIMNRIYRYPEKPFEFKAHISSKLIKRIKEQFHFTKSPLVKKTVSSDGTQKFLTEVASHKTIESVLISFKNNYSLCVSSQIGCAMNCSFCHTAKQGLQGQLKVEDIIYQYIHAHLNRQRDIPITTIVFMGQGEPLHNFDVIKDAIDILCEPQGISIGRGKVTVSTSGYLPGIERFHELGGVNFALSLHSVNNDVRSMLIPLNKKYPLQKIDQFIQTLNLKEKQFIEYEYMLIKGLNDSINDAKQLASFVQGKKAIVNIIPYNEFFNSQYQTPEKKQTQLFIDELVKNKIRTMLRGTKGDDIMAACGQLNSSIKKIQ